MNGGRVERRREGWRREGEVKDREKMEEGHGGREDRDRNQKKWRRKMMK